MFELLIPALIAASVAGLWDLKTTEVPDEIPAIMIIAGLSFWGLVALFTGDYAPLMSSAGLGTIVLLIGLALYKKGQWGGADAWILAAIFYMIPNTGFLAGYILNFFFVSLAYMLVYSAVLGIIHKGTGRLFVRDVRKSWKYVVAIPLIFVAAMAAFSAAVSDFSFVVSLPFAGVSLVILLMAVFWRYGVVVEKHIFRRKVNVTDLKKGDVVEGGIWVGLTEAEIRKIRAKKKYVIIKEGVRFVPVFPITLAVTHLFGTLIPPL